MRNPKDFAETELVRYSGANLGVDPKKEKRNGIERRQKQLDDGGCFCVGDSRIVADIIIKHSL